MAGSPKNSLGNVRSDMDTPYPEHLSRLNRHLVVEWSKPLLKTRRSSRPRNRYRTQPVTFDEIQEVDEDSSILDSTNSAVEVIPTSISAEMDLDIFQLSGSVKSKLKTIGIESNEDAGKGTSIEGKSLEKKRKVDKNREGSV